MFKNLKTNLLILTLFASTTFCVGMKNKDNLKEIEGKTSKMPMFLDTLLIPNPTPKKLTPPTTGEQPNILVNKQKNNEKAVAPADWSKMVRDSFSSKDARAPTKVAQTAAASVAANETTWAEVFIRYAIELCLESLKKNPQEQATALKNGNDTFAALIGASAPSATK